MDTYMEKLAHRLTAQEMILANTAAEAEEVNNLKSQVKDYHECLRQIDDLVKEGTDQIRSLQNAEKEDEQKLQAQLDLLYDALNAASEKNAESNIQTIERLQTYLEGKLEADAEQRMTRDRLRQQEEKQADEALLDLLTKLQQDLIGVKETSTRQNVQVVDELKQTFQEGFEEIKAKNDNERFEKIETEIERVMNAVRASGERTGMQNVQVIEELKQYITEQFTEAKKTDESLEDLKRFVERKLNEMSQDKQQITALDDSLNDKFDKAHEKVHMECVKVYRNVQAATQEENEKQMVEMSNQFGNMKKKLGAVTVFAAVASATSVISMILVLLSVLHII